MSKEDDLYLITKRPVAYTFVDPQIVAFGQDPRVTLHLDRDPNDPRVEHKQKLVISQRTLRRTDTI